MTLQGWFIILRSSNESGDFTLQPDQYVLFTTDEKAHLLEIDINLLEKAGGAMALDRQLVTVMATQELNLREAGQIPEYKVIELNRIAEANKSPRDSSLSAINGSHPWVSILCKFQDVAGEPKSLEYFQGMFSENTPGLGHFWRELSYNAVDLTGSTALGWYNLPQPRAYYVSGNQLNWEKAAQDCTRAADGDVYFPDYAGINLMFNDELDGYAWGGSNCMTLDDIYQCWRITWEPPWGYSNNTVIAHEMGHGFGLPHSSGTYGETYDNQWDVMSDGWSNCNRTKHESYGCLGQHTIAYHKDILGWIPEEKKIILSFENTVQNVESTNNAYLMAQINLPTYKDNNPATPDFYTLEFRSQDHYDAKLPGGGIIIHEVNPARQNPAQVIDIDNNGNTGDSGAIWTVGESFVDSTNQVRVSILAFLNEKYQVEVITGSQTAIIWLEPLAQTSVFKDVSIYHWAHNSIIKLYNSQITGGCSTSPLMYCPQENVTRAQMAIFLELGLRGATYQPLPPNGNIFGDVPASHWAAAWIEQLAQDHITNGCGEGNYCPESPVTRAQMAIFLLKAKHGPDYSPPSLGENSGFNDVPKTHWAAAWIRQLAAENITSGCGDGVYCPETPVSRAQMAVFLVNIFNLP
jgi:M6 family metalloprotease-like protein